MFFSLVFLLAGSRGDTESGDADSRRIVRYPDSHQLFVGNLPHDIDESELKEFFMSMFSWKAILHQNIKNNQAVLEGMNCYFKHIHLISFCSIWKCGGAADQHQGCRWEAAQLWICGFWRLWSCAKNPGGQGRRGMYQHFKTTFIHLVVVWWHTSLSLMWRYISLPWVCFIQLW